MTGLPSPLGLASYDATAFASAERRRAIRTSVSQLRLMHARLPGLDLSSARGQGRDLEQT